MTESQIKSAVDFVADSGPRTHAMAILKIDDKGDVQVSFTGPLPAMSYMKDIFENFVQANLTKTFEPTSNG